jgi:hypothetical protein
MTQDSSGRPVLVVGGTIGGPDARWTYVHTSDLARCLALANSMEGIEGARIDMRARRAAATRPAVQFRQ